MANIAKHIVPAHYLRGFTKPNRNELWMYFLSGRKSIPTSPESVAKEHNYWSDSTEQMITENIESPAQVVIEKIRNLSTAFEYRERWHLALYMVTMAKRVKNEREKALTVAPQTIDEFLKDFSERIENLIRENPDDEEEIRMIASDPAIYGENYLASIPHRVWERSLIPQYSIDLVQHVSNMTWIFFVVDGDRKFLTTDHPFVHTRTGIKPPDGEFLFPISSEIALWGSWRQDGEYYWHAPQDVVDDANRWLIHEMRDYAFFSSQDDWVEGIIAEERRRRS